MAITKCLQTNENIIRMAKAAFPERDIPQIEELTEGMCNVAYKLTYEDGFRTILKIASPIKTGYMTNERNLMEAEVKAMNQVASHTDLKVAKIYTYDTTRTLCEGDYFFMECMEGDNWITVYDTLTEDVKQGLYREVGNVQRQLCKITNDRFGLLGDEGCRFETMFDFIYFLINNVLQDAEKRNVEIGVSTEKILAALTKDKAYFDEVKTPTLVHWDMWEGNIFTKDGKITGIIDWERAMWGEAFMDEPFRKHKRPKELLEGFGICELSETEMQRIYWYDVLLYLTMMTEVTYREYEDVGQYNWAKSLFEEVWELIRSQRTVVHTKESLINDLKNMGLKGTESIMVHSSMKSIGEVEGRADTVVDAFMEFFAEGLFMTPTHTWDQMGAEYSTFDPATEPACVGIIPNVFRTRPGVVRSLHPTHSIAAYGKKAEEYTKGEENCTSPCPPGGCWDRLREVDGKILLLGVTHGRNTFIHSVDEYLGIGDRLTDEPTRMHIVMPDGSLKDVDMYRHYNRVMGTGAFSDCFDKMKEAFYELGAAKAVKFGDADCILCDAKKIFEVCKKLFAIEETCIIEREEIPREWWDNQ